MKTFVIALKDLTRSFRSTFALMFMFVVPLMVTGMFYLMFGNIAAPKEDAQSQSQVPVTKVVIANLDRGSKTLDQGMAALPGVSAKSMGEVVVHTLQGKAFAQMIEVSLAPDAAAARAAVDSQQAGVAIIIPETFSSAFADPWGQAELEMYQDPTLTVGPQTVRSILASLMDTFSGVRIAVSTTLARGNASVVEPVVQQYLAASGQVSSPEALLEIHAPEKAPTASNPITQMVGPIMAGMMIFFAFFTGGSTAQSILQEDENGTLPRLFTTPTAKSAILGGKFLAVGLTVLVQVSLLLVIAALAFHIQWGGLAAVAMAALGIIACASAFGIFLTSLIKSTKQGGVVYGGLMTVTGMLGMMPIFTGGSSGGMVQTVSLLMPQGWAVRALSMSMRGAGTADAALNLLALLALSLAFFGIGVWRFQKRYA